MSSDIRRATLDGSAHDIDGAVDGAPDRPPWQVRLSGLVADRDAAVTRGLAYGPNARHRYDLYDPPSGQSPWATVHFIYGGSWETGERGCYQFVGAALATRGIRTVIADYRLHPEVSFPGFVDDMAAAYGHIAEHHLVSRHAPVVVGHSAGAHIGSLMLGETPFLERHAPAAPRPKAFVGLSGPYAFDPTTWDTTRHIFVPARGAPDQARPIANVHAGFPPSLLLHGGRDTLVTPNASELFHAALRDVGVYATLKVYRLLAHAGPIVSIAKPVRWLVPVLDDIVSFLRAR